MKSTQPMKEQVALQSQCGVSGYFPPQRNTPNNFESRNQGAQYNKYFVCIANCAREFSIISFAEE